MYIQSNIYILLANYNFSTKQGNIYLTQTPVVTTRQEKKQHPINKRMHIHAICLHIRSFL